MRGIAVKKWENNNKNESVWHCCELGRAGPRDNCSRHGEEGPASQSAGSFVSARQSERLSVRSALAIGQRRGRRALAGAGGGAMAGAQGGAGA